MQGLLNFKQYLSRCCRSELNDSIECSLSCSISVARMNAALPCGQNGWLALRSIGLSSQLFTRRDGLPEYCPTSAQAARQGPHPFSCGVSRPSLRYANFSALTLRVSGSEKMPSSRLSDLHPRASCLMVCTTQRLSLDTTSYLSDA